MEPTAIILIVISAFTHAGWNVLGKSRRPTTSFFLIATIIASGVSLPFILYWFDLLLSIPLNVWMWLIVTGFFMTMYYAFLGAAYRSGDMSLAYPLVRSSPIIVVTFVSLVLGKSHEIGTLCYVGIVFVVLGCLILPMKNFREFRIKNYWDLCCLFSILAAIGTSGYTIVDDEALRILRAEPGFDVFTASLFYLFFQGVIATVWMLLWVLIYPPERKQFFEVLDTKWRSAALTGITIHITYILVLSSMAFVDNVSYVAAFRQLSIPLGAIFGVFLLKEPSHGPKWIGTATVFIGLVLVGLG